MTDELKALKLVGAGQWQEAHQIVQDLDSTLAARIHAYLHRQEGDKNNARYWYRTAGCQEFTGTLAEELNFLLQLAEEK